LVLVDDFGTTLNIKDEVDALDVMVLVSLP